MSAGTACVPHRRRVRLRIYQHARRSSFRILTETSFSCDALSDCGAGHGAWGAPYERVNLKYEGEVQVHPLIVLQSAIVRIAASSFFTSKAGGTGGLVIIPTIIESDGGQLWASNNGRGTNFNFTLPVEAGQDSASGRSEALSGRASWTITLLRRFPRSRDCTRKATFGKFQIDTSRDLKYKSSGQGLSVDSLMQDQPDQRKEIELQWM
jgi:hypothetical protein